MSRSPRILQPPKNVANTLTELFLDGGGGSRRMKVPTDGVWTFDILVVAWNGEGLVIGGSAAGYRISGVIQNYAGSTSLVGTPMVTVLTEPSAAWDASVEADDANDALIIKVTAPVAARWVANVRTAELVFAAQGGDQ